MIILLNISTFIILVPIVIGSRRYSILTTESKWVLYMLVPTALNQFSSIIWSNYVHPNNLPFFYFYVLFEVIFLAKIFRIQLRDNHVGKWVVPISSMFVLFYIIWLAVEPSRIWNYSMLPRVFEGTITIFFSFCYFFDIYKTEKIMEVHKLPGFWINLGLIIYFACNLLLFVFDDLVFSQNKELFLSVWIIHAIVLILLYLSFTIAFLCNPRETKS